MTYEVQYPFASAPEYPITDDFASKEIPKFTVRRRANNPKTGFNCEPAHASRSGLASFERPGAISRGSGKTIRSDEKGISEATDIRYPGPHHDVKQKKEG